ncbi:hypothetical protein WJX84_005900 [Apatococcus fuscideae]|uniref:Uncharacterized protein n=1 Tax=Apatococcus fuscideae TaxID=2026836 RepID=A0AAW1SLK3_9CHLO
MTSVWDEIEEEEEEALHGGHYQAVMHDTWHEGMTVTQGAAPHRINLQSGFLRQIVKNQHSRSDFHQQWMETATELQKEHQRELLGMRTDKRQWRGPGWREAARAAEGRGKASTDPINDQWRGKATHSFGPRQQGKTAGEAEGGAISLVRPDVSAANAALRQLLLRNAAAATDREAAKPVDSDEAIPEVPRAVPDMRPVSRLAGAALKGLLAKARSSTAPPSHTSTSLAAVIEIDANPPAGRPGEQEGSASMPQQPESTPLPTVKPSGRLAGSAFKALGSSAGTHQGAGEEMEQMSQLFRVGISQIRQGHFHQRLASQWQMEIWDRPPHRRPHRIFILCIAVHLK